MSEALRTAIANCGLTRYRLWKETGVHQSVLGRFMARETELTMPHIDAIAAYLGLRLVVPEPKPTRGAKVAQKKRRAKQ